jgi:hypothetical protein
MQGERIRQPVCVNKTDIKSITFVGSERLVVAGVPSGMPAESDGKGSISLWDVKLGTRKLLPELPDAPLAIKSGRDALAVYGRKGLWVWQAKSGVLLSLEDAEHGEWRQVDGSAAVQGSSKDVPSFNFSQDGKVFAYRGSSDGARVWQKRQWERKDNSHDFSQLPSISLPSPNAVVKDIGFSVDEDRTEFYAVDSRRNLYRHAIDIKELIPDARIRLNLQGLLSEDDCHHKLGKEYCAHWEVVKDISEGNRQARNGRLGAAADIFKNIQSSLSRDVFDATEHLARLRESDPRVHIAWLVQHDGIKDVAEYIERGTVAAQTRASLWNLFCWFGSLQGQASDTDVMAACEEAVSLDPGNPAYRDSRGLARALSGTPGAKDDFQFLISHEPPDSELAKQRQGWLNRLGEGENRLKLTPQDISKLFFQ